MLKQVTSKRPVALLALLTLAVALLVVGANSAYATHDGGDDPPTLPFFDTFGSPPGSNDVIHWDENEDKEDYCATKNAGRGDMALQLSNGCDAYVSFEVPYGASIVVEYDWGYHTLGRTDDDGELKVRLVQLVRSVEPNTLNTLRTYTHSFQPRQERSNTGPIYPGYERFDLLSLGLQTETEELTTIIQVHFLGTSTGSQDWAWVDNVRITRGDSALPRGTVSFTQGFYGNAGEAFTCEVLAAMARYSDDAMSVDAIYGITAILSSPSVGVDMGSEGVDVTTLDSGDVDSLCLFLVGAEGVGPDEGFLPAGKVEVDGKLMPRSNLAAQNITLRVNLNLDLIYGEWGVDDGAEYRPIEMDYYLNIDPVPDPDGVMVYPLENTYGEEALGTCGISGITVGPCLYDELTALGDLVQRLDREGTTVGDMLDAADRLLLAGATNETILYINTMELTQIDVTNILSLINKSYDEGVPTGFVTAWDYD